MTLLLYISCSSGLSESEKLDMDKSVFENRLAVRKFIKKVHGKGKVVVVSTALGIVILFSGIGNADTMGLTPIVRRESRIGFTKVVPSNVRLNAQKQDKITLIKHRELPVCIYIMDEQFLRNPKVSKLIKELRGGSWTTTLIVNAIFLSVLYGIWVLGGGAKGFVPGAANPGWGLNRLNPFQPPSGPHRFPPYYEFLPPRTLVEDQL